MEIVVYIISWKNPEDTSKPTEEPVNPYKNVRESLRISEGEAPLH